MPFFDKNIDNDIYVFNFLLKTLDYNSFGFVHRRSSKSGIFLQKTKCGREVRERRRPQARGLLPPAGSNPSPGCATNAERRPRAPRSKTRSRLFQALLFLLLEIQPPR